MNDEPVKRRVKGIGERRLKRVETLYRLHGGWCPICGAPLDRSIRDKMSPNFVTIDHVTPRSLGGSSRLENQRLAHKACNGRKGSGDATLYYRFGGGTGDDRKSAGLMAIHEYKVTLFLEIESEKEQDPLLVEEAVTSLFDEAIHRHATTKATLCGLSFHDVDEVVATKT